MIFYTVRYNEYYRIYMRNFQRLFDVMTESWNHIFLNMNKCSKTEDDHTLSGGKSTEGIKIIGYLDNPVDFQRGFFRFNFNGWVVPSESTDKIEVTLNGIPCNQFKIRRIKRPDLRIAFPDLSDAERGGFEGIVTVGDKEGIFRLSIQILTDTGEKVEIGNKTIRNTKEVIHDPPLFLGLGVIGKCNLSCKMCPKHSSLSKIESKNDVMDAQLVEKIISQLGQFSPKLKQIEFQDYGEPFLYKDIFKLVDRVARFLPDCRSYITTNGCLLNSELIEQILQSKIYFIQFSLDACTESTYNKIRKGGDFSKVITNIKLLVSRRDLLNLKKPFIATNFIILRSNIHELRGYIDLGESLGVDKIGFVLPFGLFDSDKNEVITLLNEEENEYSNLFLQIKNELNDIYPNNQKRYRIPDILPNECLLDCSFRATSQIFIDTKGNVYPCCVIAVKAQEGSTNAYAMGNCNNQSLQEIWDSSKFIQFREKFYRGELPCAICKDCLKYYGL